MKKINVLDILFICIVLSLIPVSLLRIFKISNSIYLVLNAVVYLIQSLLLLFSVGSKIKMITKKQKILLALIILNGLITILFDILVFKSFNVNEVIFIVSFFINVLFLIFLMDHNEINEVRLYIFLQRVCCLGLISVILNIVLNVKTIMNIFNIRNSYDIILSSFFPNRNQYGLFMLLMIIFLSIQSCIKYEKKNILMFIIFSISLLFTMSRNSIIGLIIFSSILFSYKILHNKELFRKRNLLIFILVVVSIVTIGYFLINKTNVLETVDKMFLRVETIKNGAGRIGLWKNGIDIGIHNDPIFGVGRYQALELNKTLFNNNLSQFHSVYIEKFVTHGLLGLYILFELYRFVWKKVCSIKNDKFIRIVLIAGLFAFYFVSAFETTTRFSIGYTDFFFTFSFFSLPILISNIYSE